MKFSSIICCLLLASLAFGQKNDIDKLTSKEAVETFIQGVDDNYQEFTLAVPNKMPNLKGRQLADSLGFKTWVKTDFNADGQTDLLVLGIVRRYLMLAVIAENDGYRVERLSPGTVSSCMLPFAQKIDEQPAVVFYYAENGFDSKTRKRLNSFSTDTLIYKNSSFLEYNAKPSSYDIHRLRFQTSPCADGGCPVVELVVEADGKATYKDWENKGKTFKGQIDEISLVDIFDLLNYVDFPHLKNKYDSGSREDKTVSLTITYGEDEQKRIIDSGQAGTHGLTTLYGYLFDLLETQDWEAGE